MDKHKHRFTEIDLLRFIAALSVMVYHYTMKISGLAPYTTYGRLGVNLFFLISGFVIMMTAVGRSPKDFVISRMVRLYPAYWACCTITFLVAFLIGTGDSRLSVARYISNLPMLHGFFHLGHIDGVYWTLFIEMKFYLLIFVLLCTRQLHRIEMYLGIWLALSILSLRFLSGPLDTVLITGFSPYFIAGAVFYLIYQNGPSFYRAFLLLASFALEACHVVSTYYLRTDRTEQQLSVTVVLALLAAFYCLFFLIARQKTGWVRSRIYVTLGVLTYPLYLLHSHIWYVVGKLPVAAAINKQVLAAGMMILMMILAYLVHIHVEKRFAPRFKSWLQRKLKAEPPLPRRSSRNLVGKRAFPSAPIESSDRPLDKV